MTGGKDSGVKSMETNSGDTDSECEYVERVEANLRRRAAQEDLAAERRALLMYAAHLRNEAGIRNLRLQHQWVLKDIHSRIQQLCYRISVMEGRYQDDNDLKLALARPYCNRDALKFAYSLLGKSEASLRKVLDETRKERDLEVLSYERILQDLIGRVSPPGIADMCTVRTYLVHRHGSSKHRRLQQSDNSTLLRGEQIIQQKRNENSLFTAFFEKHGGKRYLHLKHNDIAELGVIFQQADVNNSGSLEEDDFSKLVRRLLCDYGVTQGEVDRIAMLCHLSVADGFAIGLEEFFDMSCLLRPLVEAKADEFLIAEDESSERLRARQSQAASDATALFQLELASKKKIERLRQDASLLPQDVDDQLLKEHLDIQGKRLKWATTATVLTVKELDRIRIQNIVKARQCLASPSSTAGTAGHAGSNALPSSPSKATGSSSSTPRIPSAPPSQRNAGGAASGSSKPLSATSILDVFKTSVRSALHRAPFVEVRSADDIPNEKVEREFYQLFTVLSKQEEFITSEHLLFLLDIFTPCGADADEARLFLKEECDGAETLVFDEFIKYGLNVKYRLLAYESFAGLPSDRQRAAAIEQRVAPRGLRKHRLALRRYEKEFLRDQRAKASLAGMRKDGPHRSARHAKSADPRHRTQSASSSHHGETPEWAAESKPGTTQEQQAGDDDARDEAHHSPAKHHVSPNRELVVAPPSSRKGVQSAGSAGTSSSRHGLRQLKQVPLTKFVERTEEDPEVHAYRKLQDDVLVLSLRHTLLRQR